MFNDLGRKLLITDTISLFPFLIFCFFFRLLLVRNLFHLSLVVTIFIFSVDVAVLTLCMLGNLLCFYCRLLTFFSKINFFKMFFQEHYQSVK